MRAHVVIPEELLTAVDQLAGKRKRSQFVEAAIKEKLAREALTDALRQAVGSIDLADYPEWATPEKTSAWVRDSRSNDEVRRAKKMGRQNE